MHPRSIPRLEPYSLPARSSRGIKRTVLLGACHRWSGKVRSKGPFGPGDCWRVPPACVPDLEQTAEPMSLANAEPACPHCSSAVRQGAAPERGLAPRRPHYGAANVKPKGDHCDGAKGDHLGEEEELAAVVRGKGVEQVGDGVSDRLQAGARGEYPQGLTRPVAPTLFPPR